MYLAGESVKKEERRNHFPGIRFCVLSAAGVEMSRFLNAVFQTRGGWRLTGRQRRIGRCHALCLAGTKSVVWEAFRRKRVLRATCIENLVCVRASRSYCF